MTNISQCTKQTTIPDPMPVTHAPHGYITLHPAQIATWEKNEEIIKTFLLIYTFPYLIFLPTNFLNILTRWHVVCTLSFVVQLAIKKDFVSKVDNYILILVAWHNLRYWWDPLSQRDLSTWWNSELGENRMRYHVYYLVRSGVHFTYHSSESSIYESQETPLVFFGSDQNCDKVDEHGSESSESTS